MYHPPMLEIPVALIKDIFSRHRRAEEPKGRGLRLGKDDRGER
jgi:hypothetical protein